MPRCPAAQHCALAARPDGNQVAGLDARRTMSDAVDAAMRRMKHTFADPPLDPRR